jgi:3-oxoadipate enol-lactonase
MDPQLEVGRMSTLFLHPMGLDGGCWQLARLEGVMPDLPGHGRRPMPPALTLEAAADEVLGTVPGRFDVVGVSLGGTLAIRMALRHPERVRSLLVACTSVLDAPERSKRLRERGAAAERGGMAGVLDTTLERWFTPAALADPQHPGVAYARRRLLADDPQAFAAWWRAMAAHTVREEMGGVRCPVTVLSGRQDTAAATAHMLELFDALACRRRMEIIPGPHMLHLETPGDFAGAVERHLAWAQT